MVDCTGNSHSTGLYVGIPEARQEGKRWFRRTSKTYGQSVFLSDRNYSRTDSVAYLEFSIMTSELIQQIDSLLHLDAKGVLSPHGIGGLARELLEKCKIELNTRAVPYVPELVRLHIDSEGVQECKDGDYVLHSQAAEIIAAKDAEIEKIKDENRITFDKYLDAHNENVTLKAKLAQYEAQDPVGFVAKGFFNQNLTIYDEFFRTVKQKENFVPLYASPAPAADLKAENERLRFRLNAAADDFDLIQQRINDGQIERAKATAWQGEREARAALNAETSNDNR